MRDWSGSNKADIIVSELLGSFGCNELSPECLYGAQNLLKDDGISIPSKYTSYIAPVQSYKIYSEIKRCKEYEVSKFSNPISKKILIKIFVFETASIRSSLCCFIT